MNEVPDHEYAVHPAADIFPLMTDVELNGLVEDIKDHGQLEPIVLCNGLIIDGRNRHQACRLLGVSSRTEEYHGDGSIISYVISKNLHRRQLTVGQRAMIGAKLANMKQGYPFAHGDDTDKSVSIPEAAALLNVSGDSISNAKTILREGAPEDIEAVEAGVAAVNSTARNVRAKRGGDFPAQRAGHIKVPEGMTAEELCREGLMQEGQGESLPTAAKNLGVGLTNYRKMRDIIAVADREDLSPRNVEIVAQALSYVNETANVGTAWEQIRAIKETLWGAKRVGAGRDQSESRRKMKFDKACGVITHACNEAGKIDVPHLSPEEATNVIAEIKLAEKNLRQFRNQLQEVYL